LIILETLRSVFLKIHESEGEKGSVW